MSRGLYIDPQPLANDLMFNNNLVGQFPPVMADLAQSMQMIISDDSMSGTAYTAMKNRLRDYDLPLLNGFKSLATALPGVYRLQFALLQPVYELSTAKMDENDIDSQISVLQSEIAAETAQENLPPNPSSAQQEAAKMAPGDIALLNATLKSLQDKETAIEAYDSASAYIYTDANQLVDAVQRGLACVQSLALSPNGWTTDADMSWKDAIDNCSQRLYEDLDKRSLDLTAQNPDLMILSPDGQVIYHNGIAYQVYDPTEDPDFASGADPTLEDGWTTDEFKGASADTTDSAMTIWLKTEYPESFDDADDEKKPLNSTDKKMNDVADGLGLFNSWSEACQDSKHDASVGMYFQSNGDQKRVVIVGNATNSPLGSGYDEEHYDYSDGYTTFDSSGRTSTTVNTDDGVKSFSTSNTAIANALQSLGIDAYPDQNVSNASQGLGLDPPTAK